MKRIFSLIITLILIVGLAIPAVSSADTPKTPAIKSTSPGTTTVTVSWNAVSGARGYEIAWGKKGSPDFLDDTATTTSTSVKVSGLKENTTYAFRVRAYYKSGTRTKYTSWSAKKFVTTKTHVPSAPGITGLSYSGGKVTVKWNSDSRAAGYEVSWSEKGPSPWGKAKDVGKTGSAVIKDRIITGTTMAFRVRAYWWEGKKIKYTSWSDTKYVKTTESGRWVWSDWSKTRQKVTGNMKEQVRYHLWSATCKSCGTHNPYWGSNIKCSKCGRKLSSDNVKHDNIYIDYKPSLQKIGGRKDGVKVNGQNYWYCEPQYRYASWK